MNKDKYKFNKKIFVSVCVYLWLISLVLFLNACNEIKSPKPEPYIGQIAPPRRQEFRWSNGKMPKSFDPALAAASPETDIVRALFEGLTDLDSKTLKPVPAVAAKWTASADFKIWTFQLRPDAKWSNGEPVTAEDFVNSWKRLAEMGADVAQRDLLKNIVGMDTENTLPVFSNKDEQIFIKEPEPIDPLDPTKSTDSNTNTANIAEQKTPQEKPKAKENQKSELKKGKQKRVKIKIDKSNFGVEAVAKNLLKVTLKQPDENFPALVANPIFRPVYDEGKEFDADDLNANIVTDGAFRLAAIDKNSISLTRDENYWNKDQVQLEKVKFVVTENAESALAAYRAGEVDALTNANFQPLALKLLTPFDELRRTKHSALNFYEFNLNQKPFDDRRVREALAIGFDRERLTEDETDGATDPALSFLPFENESRLSQNTAQAKKLLADAGYANGQNFPPIHLVINRNDLQKRIAHSIAKMWKKNLNIDTEISVKDQADLQSAVQNGEFDVVRRGIVLPTADEAANMLAMFEPRAIPENKLKKDLADTKVNTNQILTDKTAESSLNLNQSEDAAEKKTEPNAQAAINKDSGMKPILTEEQALESLPAIPLYFPASYSLIKPYIQGFDSNALDAPSLKNVKIDNNWQPSNKKIISNN